MQAIRKRFIRQLFSLFSLFIWSSAAWGQAVDTSAHINNWLTRPELKFGNHSLNTAPLYDVYQMGGFKPLWLEGDTLNAGGAALLQSLMQAGDEGLAPERYRVDVIKAIQSLNPSDPMVTMQRRISLELLLSDGLLRYASDMLGGTAPRQWDTGATPVTATDINAALLQIAQSADPAAELASLAPIDGDYNALKKVLRHYHTLADQGGWPEFPQGATLKPGATDQRVEPLRRILLSHGDMPQGSYAGDQYDGAIVQAVKQFQARHGLEPDGVIGPKTQETLNMSAADRVAQIALTLERMRWMPHNLGNRYVLVNVPAYRLKAVSGYEQLTMDVIVGKPSTPTPLFSKHIKTVSFNPTWTVPSKIAVNEMLPKIRDNPYYLDNAGYSIINGYGQELASSEVDWWGIGQGYFPYTLRQNAGNGNALGKVKFTIPNSDNIYLHDTSQRALFARTERSLSHGCIRLSDPQAMTEWVLNAEGWNKDKVHSTYQSSASRAVNIAPLPVHLVYWTAWVDEAGKAHFSRDIYGKDKALQLAMNHTQPTEAKIQLASSE